MKRKLKRVGAFIADNWHLGLFATVGLAAVSALLLFKLGSLVKGLSESEFALQQYIAQNGLTLGDIARDPLFLPYYLGQYLVQLSPFQGPTAVRSVGVLFGILGVIGFFYIIRNWYTRRVAFMGATLFATSAWFLHSARFASEDSTYLLLPLLIAGVVALQAKARAKRALLAVIVFGLAALYIPGVIWFLLAAVIIQRRTIIKGFRSQPWWFNGVVIVIGLVMLLPLVVMLIKPLEGGSAVTNILALLGLPGTLPTIGEIGHNFASIFGQIFAYSNAGPLYTAGRLPWLDVCSSVLLLIGAYRFARHYKLNRTILISIVISVSIVLISLGGPVSLIILLPFLYLFIVEGLKWLLDRWLGVFPTNPFARGFAVSIITILVLSVATLQLSKYYLAWGQAPETRAVFDKIP